MYRWELLTVCHHPGKSCEPIHCDSGDIVFLTCHVTSQEHMFDMLYEFMGGSPSRRVTSFPCMVAMFGGHKCKVQVEIKSI